MNSKLTTNSQLSTTEPKKKKQKKTTHNKTKNELSKQQEQNHRNGDHMEGYQQGSGRGREGEKFRE